jgi:hypothetical protein
MITAADIDTLLFDVLGTVVDEAGSMRAELAAELAAALAQATAGDQAEAGSRLRRESTLRRRSRLRCWPPPGPGASPPW